jgi:putative toxin-antitoxin system antitoxin component (TIGR02293 family)
MTNGGNAMSKSASAKLGGVSESGRYEGVAELFGGKRALGRDVKTQLDAHELLDEGLNCKALDHLVNSLDYVKRDAFLNTIGMSERTYHRHKELPQKRVNPDQSGRAWRFAEVLSEATEVFGSKNRAEQWLERPAIGLNRKRPIDLLRTPAGSDLVGDFLGRVKYGVYT